MAPGPRSEGQILADELISAFGVKDAHRMMALAKRLNLLADSWSSSDNRDAAAAYTRRGRLSTPPPSSVVIPPHIDGKMQSYENVL